MSDGESNVEGVVNAVSGLVEKVPVYQDAVQPLAKEVGKALGTVGRTVNAALLPIRGLVWGMEQIEDFVQSKITKKLQGTPPENIQTPDLSIAGPAIESLRFTGHKEDLAEMYANLLATSMDKSTAKNAHPGFVEIIRSLSGDEARILSYLIGVNDAPVVDLRSVNNKVGEGWDVLQYYVSTIGVDAGCEHEELMGSYLKNLERLGLVDIPKDQYIQGEGVYDRIVYEPRIKEIKEALEAGGEHHLGFAKYHVSPSTLGRLFVQACVVGRDNC